MTTLLCVNPHSRSGDGFDIGRIKQSLREIAPVIECDPDAASQVESALRETNRSIERIVIGGGDGTINGALPMLLETGLPCGIIPLGTANDFARSLQLSLDPNDAAAPIVAGHTRRVDVGEINGHLFLNAAGIGLGPELTRRLDRDKKKRLGVLAYFSGLLHAFHHMRFRHASITVDGERHRQPYIQITIANGVHYGGGMTISEEAAVDDGLLRVLCLEPQTLMELIAKILPLRWGRNAKRKERDKMSLYEGREVSVKTWRKVDVTADGELVTKTPVQCTIRPQALEFYAPPAEDPGRPGRVR